MKKFSIIALFVALAFGATSCTKENVSPAKVGTVSGIADKSDLGTNQYPPP